jgi:hypothetical protein
VRSTDFFDVLDMLVKCVIGGQTWEVTVYKFEGDEKLKVHRGVKIGILTVLRYNVRVVLLLERWLCPEFWVGLREV